jgi:hypothetical protein
VNPRGERLLGRRLRRSRHLRPRLRPPYPSRSGEWEARAGKRSPAVATARCNDDDCVKVDDSSGLCNHETNRCCRLGIYLGENAMRRRGRKTHARPCTQPLLETEFELLLREFAPAPSGALKRTRMVLDEFIARDARVACPIAFAASIRSVSAAGGGLSNFRCLFLRARGRPNAGP